MASASAVQLSVHPFHQHSVPAETAMIVTLLLSLQKYKKERKRVLVPHLQMPHVLIGVKGMDVEWAVVQNIVAFTRHVETKGRKSVHGYRSTLETPVQSPAIFHGVSGSALRKTSNLQKPQKRQKSCKTLKF